MRVIREPMELEGKRGTAYPPRYAGPLQGRLKRFLTDTLGLTQFGVNITTLEPGAISSQRHWHSDEDEFVYIIDGELVLVSDSGEQTLGVGAVAGFPKGESDGHQLINRSEWPATYLEIGTRASDDTVTYPDIDMAGAKRGGPITFTTKSGEPIT